MYQRFTDWNREGELICIHCYTNWGRELLFEGPKASLVCPGEGNIRIKMGVEHWWNDTDRRKMGVEHWWNDTDRRKMGVEHWWNDTDRRKQKYWGNTCPSATLPQMYHPTKSCLTFRRRIKSRLPFSGIIRRLPYSTRVFRIRVKLRLLRKSQKI